MPRDIDPKLFDQAVHTLQMLAVDTVEKAQSGHPGAPMGLAGIALAIWLRELRYDPKDPGWVDRDRFVLSCGHASSMLYGLLHLAGYDLPLSELKRFRQWKSRTPGHPEVHLTPGVETTTGPLGQGISNAVGMATSLKMLAARVAPHAPGLVAGRVFGICSDGDLMEGVSAEAASLAGHLGLDNLVFFYDDNRISIDGPTSLAFTEDVGRRFEAYGWHVLHTDGHDPAAVAAALAAAVAEPARPSLVVARTHIGCGSPNKQDTSKAHGEPLGPKEVALTKQALGWPEEPTFLVPDEVRALFAARAAEGAAERQAWCARRDAFLGRGGDAASLYEKLVDKSVPPNLLEELCQVAPAKDNATRVHSGVIEQRAAALVPSLVGGSADLAPSTKTLIADSPAVGPGAFGGRNFHFGVREHAMGSFVNGMALTEGFIPFGATFLVFADYMRPALRLAALSHLQSIFIYTHDSVYLGEDGPTHQPVEQLWSLRAIPGLDVFRPADALECAAAWTHALERRDGPTAIALSRQTVPNLARPAEFDPRHMLRGAYVLSEPDAAELQKTPVDAAGELHAVLIATGAEVGLAAAAAALLAKEEKRVRVVSAPCWDAFLREDQVYRDAVLPPGVRRAAIELGVSWPWRAWVGPGGLCLGHDDFGTSAPWEVIRDELGFTPTAVAERVRAWLAR
ncbi:MAG: transketolase [Myxococcales bacterium]|nr:transketolase [Myxococcales bacterium]